MPSRVSLARLIRKPSPEADTTCRSYVRRIKPIKEIYKKNKKNMPRRVNLLGGHITQSPWGQSATRRDGSPGLTLCPHDSWVGELAPSRGVPYPYCARDTVCSARWGCRGCRSRYAPPGNTWGGSDLTCTWFCSGWPSLAPFRREGVGE